MKSFRQYFTNNGFIYGVSEEYTERWNGYIVKFTNLDKAIEWVNSEHRDFRERCFITKSEAERLVQKYDYKEILEEDL